LPPLVGAPVEPEGAELLVAAPLLVELLLLPQPASAAMSPTMTPTRSVGIGFNISFPLL
jgi:hypothetical protein